MENADVPAEIRLRARMMDFGSSFCKFFTPQGFFGVFVVDDLNEVIKSELKWQMCLEKLRMWV